MPCPSPDHVLDFLTSGLDDLARDEFEAHIDGCDDCRRLLVELARTDVDSVVAIPRPTVPERIGRYRVERRLGDGSMGTVYAAYDPQLDRRVAVKLVHPELAERGGSARLVREGRALARLSHRNVVSVYDADTDGDRVYVAMELVDGETLADWLGSHARSADEIIAAFVDAGRGLAAAHEAGIVHRDFKPQNVLRDRNGRIVVTDFGIARDAQDVGVADATGLSLPSRAEAIASSPTEHSPLAVLTVTGALVGTPAYMAPEQWRSGAVTPATDQFAYCVALWEALAGERPFRGTSHGQLRSEVEHGPAALDASRIPPRLRTVLRRGLDPEPDRRWPSVQALVAAMAKAHRRPWRAFSMAGVGCVAAAIAYLGIFGSPAEPAVVAPSCPSPAIDPATVTVAAARRFDRAPIEADLARWRAARDRACTEPATLQPELACLDGVLVRLKLVSDAVSGLPADVPPVDAGAFLIAPSVCSGRHRPRLDATISPAVRDVVAALLRADTVGGPIDPTTVDALIERTKSEPCGSSLARLLAAAATRQPDARKHHLDEAEQAAERCGDDRVHAEVAVVLAERALDGGFLSATISASVQRASLAVERVAQPDLTADVERLRMLLAKRADHADEAVARGELAMRGYAARGRYASQISVGLTTLDVRKLRGTPEDLERNANSLVEWRALAVRQLGASHPIVRRIDGEIAMQMFVAGDVVGSYARLEHLRVPVPLASSRHVRGRVVDGRGRPVAGAIVSAGSPLVGSSAGAAIAAPSRAGAMRVATTDPDGGFELPDAPEQGMVVAQLADRRSSPVAIADAVTLVLEPTSRIEGRIDLRGEPASRVIVSVQRLQVPVAGGYELIAPVAPDGSFIVEGVPRAKLRVYAALPTATGFRIASLAVDASRPVRAVQLVLPGVTRVVHVIVRSTVGAPVANAQVLVAPGIRSTTTLDKLDLATDTAGRQQAWAAVQLARQVEPATAPAQVIAAARAGDLFASMENVPEGVASACVIGLPGDLADPELDRTVQNNLARLEMRCVPIPADASTVIVGVPPWPRLE